MKCRCTPLDRCDCVICPMRVWGDAETEIMIAKAAAYDRLVEVISAMPEKGEGDEE